jgi:glycosyltransferase involved in cell wall biosynthesis
MTTTIVIPYNKDRGYLSEAIASAKRQGCEYLPWHGDFRIGKNINDAMVNVKTPYVTFMAEDDILPEGSVFFREKALESSGADFVHGRGVLFFEDGREIAYQTKKKIPTLADMLVENQICGGTPLYKTELFHRFGGWDESLWTAEEYDFHMKLLAGGAKIGWCDRVVYNIRVHKGQKSVGVLDREYQRRRLDEINMIRGRY